MDCLPETPSEEQTVKEDSLKLGDKAEEAMAMRPHDSNTEIAEHNVTN